MKTKYYYTDENGIERLARTSEREYHFYCLGKCSKTYDGALAEKTYQTNMYTKQNDYYKRVLADDKLRRKTAKGWYETEEEVIKNYTEFIEYNETKLEKIKNAKVYELYTK